MPSMNRLPILTARLLHALKARGATEISGIPGDFALPLFREIERQAVLPLHTLSHEPAVGFAADAAARARGQAGVDAGRRQRRGMDESGREWPAIAPHQGKSIAAGDPPVTEASPACEPYI